MKKFNINDTMYVCILPKGWEHLNKKYGTKYVEEHIKPRKIMINNKAYYAMQCHDVISTFPVVIGCHLFYETEVLFKDNDLQNF